MKYRRTELLQAKDYFKISSWVGSGKKVLELGCHAADLGFLLKQNGNYVVGVDIDENALSIAAKRVDKVYQIDLNTDRIKNVILDTFDIVICNHVLEHLVHPGQALSGIIELLAEKGFIIIGLPNLLNARNRFAMTFGKFQYELTGVMDETHLRFFCYTSAVKFIQRHQLEIIEYLAPIKVNPIREFIDQIPFFFRLKKLFNPTKSVFGFSNNITDVVMLFYCSKKCDKT